MMAPSTQIGAAGRISAVLAFPCSPMGLRPRAASIAASSRRSGDGAWRTCVDRSSLGLERPRAASISASSTRSGGDAWRCATSRLTSAVSAATPRAPSAASRAATSTMSGDSGRSSGSTSACFAEEVLVFVAVSISAAPAKRFARWGRPHRFGELSPLLQPMLREGLPLRLRPPGAAATTCPRLLPPGLRAPRSGQLPRLALPWPPLPPCADTTAHPLAVLPPSVACRAAGAPTRGEGARYELPARLPGAARP
mmetsp:Transcript_98479/g.220473  ORF Transcript_98479/g.220473 Transcript_98479/m.220473 type:complete len:253 (-) Transcript_98479:36-794(-)